ncbi:MAG TPA: DUF177 domain-containing protein [Clostridiales bacterium]|nr:DUF177 domain-containing protein [Clostridiales bacterium]
MKVDVSRLARMDGAYQDLAFEGFLEGQPNDQGEVILDRPVRFQGRIGNAGGILKLDGILETEYAVRCARCLEDLRIPLKAEVHESFAYAGNTDGGGPEDGAYYRRGDAVELDKPLLDNIFLSFPQVWHCSPACRGLCPVCGTNLNQGMCRCSGDLGEESEASGG